MDVRVASLSDRGRSRELNEDSLLPDYPLIAVADGMGGHEGGEVASKMAVDGLQTWKDRLTEGTDPAATLREAVAEVHKSIYDRGREEEALAGMGTTLTAGWIDDDKLTLAHVGDSRAYLLRNARLKQLTKDQTVAQEWARRGRISEDEAATSPHRHILLQAVGADADSLDVDTSTVALRPGDRLLFATDGLYGMVVDTDRLKAILTSNTDPDDACRALVAAANEAGGEDNISVLIVDVAGDPLPDDEAEDTGDIPAVPAVDKVKPSEPKGSLMTRIPRAVWIVSGIATVLAVVLAGFLVVWQASSQLLVSSRDGHVVILEGTPGTDSRAARGEVVREFPEDRVERFARTAREDLRAGIPIDEMKDAPGVIARLPVERRSDEAATPTPKPSPSPTGSPDAQDA